MPCLKRYKTLKTFKFNPNHFAAPRKQYTKFLLEIYYFLFHSSRVDRSAGYKLD